MTGEPVLYDPATDTLLVEVRSWPAALKAAGSGRAGARRAAKVTRPTTEPRRRLTASNDPG